MTWENEQALVILGDCREVMKQMPKRSVDAIVTDPPYGLEFMGQEWDKLAKPKPGNLGGFADGNKPSFYRVRKHLPAMQHWHYTWAVEALGVLKPGGYMLVAGIGRTHHWMMVGVEEAGFECRDVVCHVFGQGFPKSHNVANEIDKAMGESNRGHAIASGSKYHPTTGKARAPGELLPKYQARTPPGRPWEGWGTALKPAVEFWILFRKPISERNIAENVLRWGVGGLAIDRCRIQGVKGDGVWSTNQLNCQSAFNASPGNPQYKTRQHSSGRWPANFILSHSPECVLVGEKKVKVGKEGAGKLWSHYRDGTEERAHASPSLIGDEDANETVEVWACVPDCPVRLLDEQSGQLKSGTGAKKWKSAAGYQGSAYGKESRSEGTPMLEYGDSGGASRFFYTPKASRSERNAGLPEGVENSHPTVKPLALMRYLCRLITPPGGLILDVFCGSGTTLVAGLQEGFRVIGIDNDADSCEIARYRVLDTPRGVSNL